MGTYALTDCGTWIRFKNRETLRIIVEGDERLFNQVNLMNPGPAPDRQGQGGASLQSLSRAGARWVEQP